MYPVSPIKNGDIPASHVSFLEEKFTSDAFWVSWNGKLTWKGQNRSLSIKKLCTATTSMPEFPLILADWSSQIIIYFTEVKMKTPPNPIYLQVKISCFVHFPSKKKSNWKYITRIIYWSFPWPVTTLNSTRLAPGTSCKPAKRPARGPPHLGKHLGPGRLGACFLGGCWIYGRWKSYHKLFGISWPLYWSEMEKCLKMRWWDAPKASQDMLGRHLSKWHYATSNVYTRRLIQKCLQNQKLNHWHPTIFLHFHIPISMFFCIFFSSSLALLPVLYGPATA